QKAKGRGIQLPRPAFAPCPAPARLIESFSEKIYLFDFSCRVGHFKDQGGGFRALRRPRPFSGLMGAGCEDVDRPGDAEFLVDTHHSAPLAITKRRQFARASR